MVGTDAFIGRIEQSSFLVATGHIAIRDGDMVGGPCIPEPERAFQTDTIIPRRIDAAVRDAHVAAAVDVNAVTVGINFQIVDGEIVDACR